MVFGMGEGSGYGEDQWAIHSVLDVDGRWAILGAQEAILGKVGALREALRGEKEKGGTEEVGGGGIGKSGIMEIGKCGALQGIGGT